MANTVKPAPVLSKEQRLKALRERRANPPQKIDNGSLPSGSPMYYYCISCGALADVKNEGWFLVPPKTLCAPCQELSILGWLEE